MNKKLFFISFLVTAVNGIQAEDKFNSEIYCGISGIEIDLTIESIQHEQGDQDIWKELEGQVCMSSLIEQIKGIDGVTRKAFSSNLDDESNKRIINILVNKTSGCSLQKWKKLCKYVKNFEETLNSKNFQGKNDIISNFHVCFSVY